MRMPEPLPGGLTAGVVSDSARLAVVDCIARALLPRAELAPLLLLLLLLEPLAVTTTPPPLVLLLLLLVEEDRLPLDSIECVREARLALTSEPLEDGKLKLKR